ncbi:MAG: GNAT family N-acetyltransferase [Polyangiaceae bacterium]|nr:GNAT family N-acetyltransferase [Polyangiaceae bacterium]
MWRIAEPRDDDAVIEMCMALYREDPSADPVPDSHIRRTLTTLRREPSRGRAVVLEIDGRVVGYSLLIAFWSNELGGQTCDVDELYVLPEHRNRGLGTSLFDAIERAEIWPERPAAIALIVTPDNHRARKLYERLGFRVMGTTLVRPYNS